MWFLESISYIGSYAFEELEDFWFFHYSIRTAAKPAGYSNTTKKDSLAEKKRVLNASYVHVNDEIISISEGKLLLINLSVCFTSVAIRFWEQEYIST